MGGGSGILFGGIEMRREKKIGVVAISGVIGCFIIAAVVSLFFAEKHFDYGLDFSNGKNVIVKKENGKQVWKRYIDCKERENILKKYHLGSKKPILSFYGSNTYKYTFLGIDTQKNGLKFWAWKFYLFEEQPVNKVRGYSPYSTFFYIVEKYKPSQEEIKKMYSECIRIFESKDDVFRRTLVYMKERHSFYRSLHPELDKDSKQQMRRYQLYPQVLDTEGDE